MSTLLKNVHFIEKNRQDVTEGQHLIIDNNGIIQEVTDNSDDSLYDRVLDLENFYLSAGWIDFHSHVYYGVSNLGVNPDEIGPVTGVTALVDAGSAGSANFLGLREYIIKNKSYPIYSLLNIGATGLILSNQVSEFDSLEKLDLDRLEECVETNRQYIKGIKIRASGVILRGLGLEAVKIAKKAAVGVGLPLMVHVGEPLPLLEDILPVLGKGDIVTHYYHGKKWGIFENGEIIPAVKDAVERGVLFDVGHGEASFSFSVAEKALSLGYKPYTISTDLHQRNINGPVFDLATTMSKIAALGMPLSDVIEAVTLNPAKVLGMETFADGIIGKKARFTAFSLKDVEINLTDAGGDRLTVNQFIDPAYVIIGDEIIEAGSRFLKG